MSVTVNVQEAKTRLSELLARVENGEEVVIARSGQPVAQLTPVERVRPREFGSLEITLSDEFFGPLPEEELVRWE